MSTLQQYSRRKIISRSPSLLFFRMAPLWMTAALVGMAGNAAAQNLYWDTNNAAAGSGTTTPVSWTASSTTWNANNTAANTNTPAAWVPGSVAVFSAGTDFGATTAYTVNVTGTMSLAGLTVEDGAPTIAGGTLSSSVTTLPLTVNASRSGIVSSAIAGTNISKAGAGALTLSGTNTFTGTVNVPTGTGVLQFNSNAATGTAAGAYMTVSGTGILSGGFNIDQSFLNKITSGSTGVVAIGADASHPLNLSGLSSTFFGAAGGARTYWGTLTPQTGGYRLGGGNNELIVNTSLSGSNNLVVGGGNVVRLTPQQAKLANTFTGNITIQDTALLRIYENGALPVTANTSIAATGGILQFLHSNNNTYNFNRALGTEANQVQILGGSSGFASQDGRVNINLGGAGSTIQWGSATFNPSTFQLNGSSGGNSIIRFANGIDANGANRVIQVNAGFTYLDGVLSNSAGTGGFEKGAGGTLVLTANNTFNGTFIAGAGTTQIGANGTTGSISANIDLNNTNNPTLRFQRSDALTYSGNITNSGTGSLTLEKAGAGTLTLTGSNTTRGVTRLQSGTLNLDFGGAGAPANDILNNSANLSALNTRGGHLTVTGATGAANSQRFNGYLVDGGHSNLTATPTGGGSVTVSLGAITRTGAGFNDGLGTANFSTTGLFTTSTANTNGILSGYLTVANTDWAANNGAGNIVALSSYTANTWAAGNNTDITTSAGASAATTNSLRYAAGSNTVTLTGANTLQSGGLLVTSGAGASSLAGSAGNTITSGTDSLNIHQHSATDFTVSAPVVGNIGIAKSGTGTAILSGAGNFTGGGANNRVIVNDGKLSLTGSFAAAATNTFVHRGDLEITGNSGTALYTTGTSSIGFRNGDVGTLTLKGVNPTDFGLQQNGDLNLADLHGSTGILNIVSGTHSTLNLFVGKGGNGTGTVNHTGGTLQTGGTGTAADWRIGGNTAADTETTGTYNLSGGTLINTARNFQIGAWGNGSIVQTGGTALISQGGGVPVIGRFGGSTGLWSVTNGIVSQAPTAANSMTTNTGVNLTQTALIVGEEGNGTLQVDTGASVTLENITLGYQGGRGTVDHNAGTVTTTGTLPWSRAAGNPSVLPGVSFGAIQVRGTGVYNLNGGTLNTPSISAGAGSGTFNFNGGTIVPTANQPTFVQGNVTTQVNSGGAIINTNGFNIGIAAELKHAGSGTDGGLTKSGNGTLTLSDAATYNGATTITGGTLKLEAAATSLPVAAKFQFDASSVSNLTLSGNQVTGWTNLGTAAGNNGTSLGTTNPTYNAAGLNGLGTVVFDTPVTGVVGQQRIETTGNTGIAGAAARTLISVMARSNNGSVFVNTGNAGTSLQAFGVSSEAGGAFAYGWGHPTNDAATGARANNTFEILANRYTGTQIEQYINGALMDISNNTALTLATTDTTLQIGSRHNAANNGTFGGGQGSVAEVLMFDSNLSDADLAAVTRYLNAKWFNIGATQNILPASTPVALSGTGILDLNGVNQEIGSLNGAATTSVLLGGGTLRVGNLNTLSDMNGNITGSGQLIKVGTGLLSLDGANSISGGVSVNDGTLGGTGSVTTTDASITFAAGTVLSPGNSPGTLTFDLGAGELDLSAQVAGSATAALAFELGATSGGGVSDLVVLSSGTLDVGSGTLNFDDFDFTALSGFGPGSYVLFDTNTSIAGTLGASLSGTVSGLDATLALADGTNDLVLNVVPEPSSAAAALAGLGVLAMRRRRR